MDWKEKYFVVKRLRNSGTDDKRPELSDNTDIRTALESDFGRVVFSPACRRLHDKTQVFPLTTNDNIHSRLTHSLEVMNIGLSFSIDLSDKKEEFLDVTGLSAIDVLRDVSAILKTACLVHDIGNPPFGHFGEVVIQNYFKSLFEEIKSKESVVQKGIKNTEYISKKDKKEYLNEGRRLRRIDNQRKKFQIDQLNRFLKDESWKCDYTEFDGNAEGFRIITKLQNAGDLYGLNLTYGTLAATIKYPNIGKSKRDSKIGNHKHGILFTERKELDLIAKACHLHKGGEYYRDPLVFLMEAADSICYLIMDIDDAITRKWVSFDDVFKLVENSEEKAKKRILDVFERVRVGNDSPRKRWMSLRTAMIGYLMEVAIKNFLENLHLIENGDFDEELIEHNNPFAKDLQIFSSQYILSQRDINKLETTGKSVISGLLDEYINLLFHPNKGFRDRAKSLLSKSILFTVIDEHIHDFPNEYKEKYGDKEVDKVFDEFDLCDLTVEERFRIIRDFIAGMTDKFALNHFQELSGQRLS